MSRPLKVLVSAFGATGHVFPALALSIRLQDRGHEVWLETLERWREVAEERGLGFIRAPAYVAPPRRGPGMPDHPTIAEATRNLAAILREIEPDVIVNDVLGAPAALAAELESVWRATLIPHPHPVYEPGLPYFLVGLVPPRTPLGAAAWRASRPWFARHARRDRKELNETRAELGLAPLRRDYGGISDQLAMVATFPQLEYPRRWPAHVHVTGPMLFELPHPQIELPDADRPLVVVAGSTAMDHELRLVHAALRGLATEPVRVLAVLNQPGRQWTDPVPANATVVDWASYSQVLPIASVVICNGGHGTVARSLAAGVPLVGCPAGGDMRENDVRVAWTGAGVMVPRPLLGARPLGWAVRRVLSEAGFATRAREIAGWAKENDGAERGAELIERRAGE
jgi:UDP:flavonoid glycosyltransferase YjiC (YdhE family)